MDQTVVDAATNVIGSLGFPIAITGFLLWKGSQLATSAVAAMNEMKVAIVSLGDRLERLEQERVKNG